MKSDTVKNIMIACLLPYFLITLPNFVTEINKEKLWVENCIVTDVTFGLIEVSKENRTKSFFVDNTTLYRKFYKGQIVDIRITNNRDIIDAKFRENVFEGVKK